VPTVTRTLLPPNQKYSAPQSLEHFIQIRARRLCTRATVPAQQSAVWVVGQDTDGQVTIHIRMSYHVVRLKGAMIRGLQRLCILPRHRPMPKVGIHCKSQNRGSHASLLCKISRPWKIIENGFGPGKSENFSARSWKVLEFFRL